jgi:hypothetical protein
MKKNLEERVASLVGSRVARRKASIQAAYVTMSEKLAKILKRHWQYVEHDAATGLGRAQVGGLGLVTWHESGSDPAVIVRIPEIRIKASSEDAARAIAAIQKIVANTGV